MGLSENFSKSKRSLWGPIILVALGYFVDVYDLILFSIVRIPSLKNLGLSGDALLNEGVLLLNMQMIGLLAGGILWGILGDKKGRLSVLFGSIILYSFGNIANAFVHTTQSYACMRLITGIGLAGELGAGITLVSEIMSKENRGYGTMIVTGVGFIGGVSAGLVGNLLYWRYSYILGGVMGLALLALRIGIYESGMFDQIRQTTIERGNFFMLFRKRKRAFKYICCILVGLPIWYVIGILITFAPEFGKALGMAHAPDTAKSVLYFYIGCAIGDFSSGFLSQYFKNRKKILTGFLLFKAAAVCAYLYGAIDSVVFMYAICGALGLGTGYWAVFVTVASEQFGTNIRATVTTTAPNFVRGAVVPLTFAFKALRPKLGIISATGVVGLAAFTLALSALSFLDETYGKDLNYIEE